MSEQRQSTRRLFFACWPQEHIRQAIVGRRTLIDGLSSRRVPDHNLHLTLLFLGNQPAERLPDLLAATDDLGSPAFDLCLDRLGWFPGARVVWLGGSTPEAAQALVQRLTHLAHGLALRFDQRRFHPHVTLYRSVAARPALPSPPPLIWPVREFALIESIPSRPYQVLRTWPLTL